MRYVTPAAVARSAAVARARTPQACVGTAWALAVAAMLVRLHVASVPRAAAVFGAVGVVTVLSGLYYERRTGGITGDFMGATEQLGELAALGVLAWGGT
jgi:adenosylcobinamide-GDP ribazoletransferase